MNVADDRRVFVGGRLEAKGATKLQSAGDLKKEFNTRAAVAGAKAI